MMSTQSPNLLRENPPPHAPLPPHPRLRQILRHLRTVAIVAIVAFVVLAWTTRSSDPNLVIALRDSASVRSFLSLLRSPTSTLAGERDDRITVLLLGMGGAGHEGPLLADTILIASVSPSSGHPTLISVPRDLLLPYGNGAYEKANAVHAYAEDRRARGPEDLAAALEDVFDLTIPYYIRVDFNGFVDLVDALGGVTITVERTVDDPTYPIAGRENDADYASRYEHLIIPAGTQRFDGALALKYVRSRGAAGVEGSDFARARRQQRLLAAIRARVEERGGLANPRQLLALMKSASEHVTTNLTPPELLRLAKFVGDIGEDDVTRIIFSDGPGGELVAGRYAGAYVLRPVGDAYAVLADRVHRAFADAENAITPLTVDIWNGTNVDGFASWLAAHLDRAHFTVRNIGNAPERTVDKTMVYFNGTSPNGEPDTLRAAAEELAQRFDATIATSFPAVGDLTDNPPDILIVLGATTAHVRAADDAPQS